MALVALVGARLDVVSVLYSLWLCGLFSLRRPALARVWPMFVVFTAVLTPLQYLLALGLPAALCYGRSRALHGGYGCLEVVVDAVEILLADVKKTSKFLSVIA